MKIRPPVSAVGDDKKKMEREGKERKGTQSHKWVIFQLFGEQTPLDRFPWKLARLKGVDDAIIQSSVGFNFLKGFQIYRGS